MKPADLFKTVTRVKRRVAFGAAFEERHRAGRIERRKRGLEHRRAHAAPLRLRRDAKKRQMRVRDFGVQRRHCSPKANARAMPETPATPSKSSASMICWSGV